MTFEVQSRIFDIVPLSIMFTVGWFTVLTIPVATRLELVPGEMAIMNPVDSAQTGLLAPVPPQAT